MKFHKVLHELQIWPRLFTLKGHARIVLVSFIVLAIAAYISSNPLRSFDMHIEEEDFNEIMNRNLMDPLSPLYQAAEGQLRSFADRPNLALGVELFGDVLANNPNELNTSLNRYAVRLNVSTEQLTQVLGLAEELAIEVSGNWDEAHQALEGHEIVVIKFENPANRQAQLTIHSQSPDSTGFYIDLFTGDGKLAEMNFLYANLFEGNDYVVEEIRYNVMISDEIEVTEELLVHMENMWDSSRGIPLPAVGDIVELKIAYGSRVNIEDDSMEIDLDSMQENLLVVSLRINDLPHTMDSHVSFWLHYPEYPEVIATIRSAYFD